MTVLNNPMRRPAPSPRRAEPVHLFKVGQSVRLKRHPGEAARTPEIYRITGTLPPQGKSLQYRIRSDEERHDRVVTEDSLESLGATGGSAVDRAFKQG